MATKSTEPWNEWYGMTEGDMIDELVEQDRLLFGIAESKSRPLWANMDQEAIRKAYWYAIGRFDNE